MAPDRGASPADYHLLCDLSDCKHADDLLPAAERSLDKLGGEVSVVGWWLVAMLALELAHGAAALGTGPR